MAETDPAGAAPELTPRIYTEGEMAALQARLREIEGKAQGIRLDRDNKRAEADKLVTDLASAQAAHAEALTRAEQRAIRADLRSELVRAGVVDTDALAFLKLADAKLTADGDVENAAEMVAALREAKPYLFGPPGAAPKPASTSSGARPPSSGAPAMKLARDMTPEEYAARKAELTKRR